MAGSLDELQAQFLSDNYKTVLRRYMEALGASDCATIKSLFAEDGTVTSPFLGLMPARDFFDRLGTRPGAMSLPRSTYSCRAATISMRWPISAMTGR